MTSMANSGTAVAGCCRYNSVQSRGGGATPVLPVRARRACALRITVTSAPRPTAPRLPPTAAVSDPTEPATMPTAGWADHDQAVEAGLAEHNRAVAALSAKALAAHNQAVAAAGLRHHLAVEAGLAEHRRAVDELRRTAGSITGTIRQRAWQDLHKPAGLILFPAWLLGACAALLDLPAPMWVPIATGAGIGALFALLNRHCAVRRFISPRAPMAVVVTGGSKGLGKALVRELLLGGDRVLLTSRSQAAAEEAAAQLRAELGNDIDVSGVACDVAFPADVAALAAAAAARLGTVDVWINNAAYSGSFQPFMSTDSEQLEQVVSTNLLGVALCSRAAAGLFGSQEGGGHLFNMDGAGADGSPTPNYAAYGATKAGIRQLSLSLQAELRGTETRVHLLSPGMILTDLLLEGATVANKQAFNILCEHPETTAAFLAPRIRSVVARGLRDTYVRYLTPSSAAWRFLTAPLRIGRYFDAEGNAVYPPELERMYGRGAKATARRIFAARRQNTGLQLAYSLSLAVSVGVLVLDATLATAGAATGASLM